MNSKRHVSALFTDLHVAGYELVEDFYRLHVESMDSPDTLSIRVSIPIVAATNYNLGKHGPSDEQIRADYHQAINTLGTSSSTDQPLSVPTTNEEQFIQDGGDFYDEQGHLIAQFHRMVRSDSDVGGARRAREAFLRAFPEYAPTSGGTSSPEKTADCKKVWELIAILQETDKEMADRLSDAFCEFECAWDAHAKEYHTDNEPEKRDAEGWLKHPDFEGIQVWDPDGWDRKNYDESWAEEITREEFEKRLAVSTCAYPEGYFKKFLKGSTGENH